MDPDNPATPDPDSSDITLSTVELGVDVEVAKHVKGHILFLWEEDDNIDGFFTSAVFSMPEDTISGVGFTAGISFISNIADSDGLSEEIVTTVRDYVSGLCAFLNVSYNNKFFFSLEHLGATDDFEAGELSFDGGASFQPSAWNFEFAYAATDRLELALKVEGGDDLGDFQVKKQYGVAALYSWFENTSLAGEYLQGEYENHDERDLHRPGRN